MPGPLAHSPADVLRWCLINNDHGTDPNLYVDDWPITVSDEPDTPDNCITLFDTVDRTNGRFQTNGEVQGSHGIQIRLRSKNHATGYSKLDSIKEFLDKQLVQKTVTIDGVEYLLYSCYRTSGILSLGREMPQTNRRIFTLNVQLSVRQTS